MKDMIEIGGVMRPATCEKARDLAESKERPIEEARQKVWDAEADLLRVCVEQYPVGSQVNVNIAAGRSPTHEVVKVNEHGWLTLKNVFSGTLRGMLASSTSISPCVSWYEKQPSPSTDGR